MGLSHRDYVLNAAMSGSHKGVAEEVWAINAMAGVIQHDRVFMLDGPENLQKNFERAAAEGRDPIDYTPWLHTHPGPIYTAMPQDPKKYPGFVQYPWEEVINCIGFPYINNTVAAAVAYAIYLKVKNLLIFGCDFTYPGDAHGSESGRGCVEFLLGIALSRGMKVFPAKHTTLLDTNVPLVDKLYGFAHEKERAILSRDEAGKYRVNIQIPEEN